MSKINCSLEKSEKINNENNHTTSGLKIFFISLLIASCWFIFFLIYFIFLRKKLQIQYRLLKKKHCDCENEWKNF